MVVCQEGRTSGFRVMLEVIDQITWCLCIMLFIIDDSEKDGEKENRYHQQKGKYKHGKTAARKTHTRKPQAPCREHLSAFSHSPTGPRFGGEGTDPSNPLDVNTMTSVLKDLQSLSTALLTKGSELPGQAQQPTERSEVQVAGYRDEGAAATQP